MPLNIDGLSVSLAANLGDFDKGIDAAVNRIQSFGVDVTRAANAAGNSFNGLAAGTQAAAGRYVDAAGKMREANGRFVSSATLAAEAAGNFGGAAANAANGFSKFARAGEEVKGLGQSLSVGITLPIAAAGAAALVAAGDMQALEKGFAATYKGAEPLADALAKVQELAKLPGLGLKEALQGATNLQAAGFSADLARRSLGAFGNALATVGRGKDDLNGVQLALGQIASKGKISAEEINQLAERVPQIRAAMQAAFGTADTEQLQKMKIGATEFVEGVTRELEKLPKVTGGINNGLENLGDSLSKAAAKVGAQGNKLFNIEGVINRAGGAIDGLIAKFEALPESTQKTIFGFAAAAAAIGPLLAGIGTLGTALPALITGFGTVGAAVGLAAGPLALIVAGVAAAAVAIIANWDDIVAYFEGPAGNVFRETARTVDSLTASVRESGTALDAFSKTDTGAAIGKGAAANFTVVKNILEQLAFVVVDQFNSKLGLVTGILNGITGILNGDFRTAGLGAVRVIEGLIPPLRTVRRLLEPAKQESISSFFDMAGAFRAADEAAGGLALQGGNLEAALGGAAGKAASLTDEQTKALEKFRQAIRTNETLANSLGADYDFIGERQKIFEQGLKSLADVGFTSAQLASRGFSQELQLLNGLLTDTDRLAGRSVEGLSKLSPTLGASVKINPLENPLTQQIKKQLADLSLFVPALNTNAFDESAARVEGTALRLTDTLLGLELPPLPPLPAFDTVEATTSLQGFGQMVLDVGGVISQGLASIIGDAATAFGQLLGTTGSIGDALSGAFQAILQGMAAFAVQFGQLLVAQGTAILLAKSIAVNPIGAIAAGAALIALGSAAGALLKKGPNLTGGAASAPSTASPYRAPASTSPSKAAGPTTQENTLIVRVVARGEDLDGALTLRRDRLGRVIGQS